MDAMFERPLRPAKKPDEDDEKTAAPLLDPQEHMESKAVEATMQSVARKRRKVHNAVKPGIQAKFQAHAHDLIQKEDYLQGFNTGAQTSLVDLVANKLATVLHGGRNMSLDDVVNATFDGTGFENTGIATSHMLDLKKMVKSHLQNQPQGRHHRDHQPEPPAHLMEAEARSTSKAIVKQVEVVPATVPPSGSLPETVAKASDAVAKTNIALAVKLEKVRTTRADHISAKGRGVHNATSVHPPPLRPVGPRRPAKPKRSSLCWTRQPTPRTSPS
jgi:hypothetical protein